MRNDYGISKVANITIVDKLSNEVLLEAKCGIEYDDTIKTFVIDGSAIDIDKIKKIK